MEEQSVNEPSRREFLRFAGYGVIAASLFSPRNIAAIELAPSEKEPPGLELPAEREKAVGWAIVGLGELALTQILPAFAQCRLSVPVALVSGHPEKAKQVAEYYGIKQSNIYDYATFDSIKENPEIEVIYIVLPNSMHAEYTVRALKAGKHVLCEKPLATSVAECREMIDAAASAKRKLMTAYRLRYEPFNRKMIELARTKQFGEIRAIVADNIQNVDAPNIRLSKKLGGGALGDVGVYCLNACRYLTGEEPVEVNAMLHRPKDDPRFAEVESTILFQLRFPSGVLANCSAGFNGFQSRRYQVFCADGSFGLDPAFSYTGLKGTVDVKDAKKMLRIEAANHFAAEMDHFSRCAKTDTDPLTPGEEGLKDVAIMQKIYEAAEGGGTIKI